MFVIKRDGTQESVKFDKITARVQKLSYGLDPAFVDPIQVAKKVIDGVYDDFVSTAFFFWQRARVVATCCCCAPNC